MYEIRLFGPLQVVVTGPGTRRCVMLAGVKPRRLLQMLALEPGAPLVKDVLAEGLWDGRPPSSYVASIESYVCVLRRTLASEGETSPLLTSHGGYVLDPARVRVDLVDVRERLLGLGEAQGKALVHGAESALRALTGEVLADEPFLPWALEVRRSLDDLVEAVLTRAAEAADVAGEHDRALRLAREVLRRCPLSEPAGRVVMRAHQASGARGQALAVYADLRAALLDELGVEPSPQTQALYLGLLGDDGPARDRPHDRDEVGLLTRLLAQALEDGLPTDAATRTWLAEVGRALVRESA